MKHCPLFQTAQYKPLLFMHWECQGCESEFSAVMNDCRGHQNCARTNKEQKQLLFLQEQVAFVLKYLVSLNNSLNGLGACVK